MKDDNFLPFEDHNPDLGETLPSDPQRTAPNQAAPDATKPPLTARPVNAPIAPDSTSRLQATRPIPPQGGHVQRGAVPPTGQLPPRRPNMPTNPYPRRTAKTPLSRRDSGLYLPWWSLALMLIGVLAASFLVVVVVVSLGGSSLPISKEPRIIIVTAPPTQPGSASQNNNAPSAPGTELLSGQNAPASAALDGPTLPAVIFTATPQTITVGINVIVAGIDGDELNVRDTAGVLGTNVLFRLREGTLLTVVEGPTQADGFTWWRVQNPSNPSQVGWAVANFLQVAGGQ
jgi:hypothetical protein